MGGLPTACNAHGRYRLTADERHTTTSPKPAPTPKPARPAPQTSRPSPPPPAPPASSSPSPPPPSESSTTAPPPPPRTGSGSTRPSASPSTCRSDGRSSSRPTPPPRPSWTRSGSPNKKGRGNMALAYDVLFVEKGMNYKATVIKVTGDASYSAGGYTLDAASCGLSTDRQRPGRRRHRRRHRLGVRPRHRQAVRHENRVGHLRPVHRGGRRRRHHRRHRQRPLRRVRLPRSRLRRRSLLNG